MVLEKLDIDTQTLKSDLSLISYTEMNSKWFKDWTWNHGTHRRKHDGKALWLWSRQWFFRFDLKSTENKSENKQLGLHQAKNFCTADAMSFYMSILYSASLLISLALIGFQRKILTM